MSLLSLVMIVRDEAAALPGFLAAHRDLAEEIVVIDTGSQDQTAELARQAGCVVARHAWSDDFAAARNAGLKLATGKWIVILDADEVIAPADQLRLRRHLEEAQPAAFVQNTLNYCPAGSHLEWQPVAGRYPEQEVGQAGYFVARRAGVFPRRDDLTFSGRVHESILPAARSAGLPICAGPVPVHHYGYARSAETNLRRRERYRRLLELKFADDPTDWSVQLELAAALLEDGEPARAVPLLEALSGGPPGLRPVVRGLYLLGRVRREQGRPDEGLAHLRRAVEQDPEFLFAWLEIVRQHLRCDDLTAAVADLDRAKASCGDAVPLLQFEELKLLVKTQRLPEARDLADRMASASPAWQDIVNLQRRLSKLV